LAGGQSKRFGENKSLVPIEGQPLALRLTQQMQSCGFTVTLVTQAAQSYASLGLRQIFDSVENSGPLAGTITALHDCETKGQTSCWIVSCDMLEWRPDWMSLLSVPDAVQENELQAKPYDELRIIETDSFLPFPCVMQTSVLKFAKETWTEGGRSMRALHSRLQDRVKKIVVASDLLPRNFNTKEELANLLKSDAGD
jgi:molybdopterin-guanine dinucleotide biosynthesis protein A